MKTKIRFVFHTPKGERWVGRAIVGWTWVLGLFYNWKVLKYNFSHEELWEPDEDGDFSYTSPAQLHFFYGRCFSSTTRGVYNGVRFAAAQEIIGKHPGRWKYIECEVDSERLEVALAEAERLVGADYDYGFVLSFLQPFLVQDPDAWACSEVLNWFKKLCRLVGKRSWRISPRRAAYLLAKDWGEPISV